MSEFSHGLGREPVPVLPTLMFTLSKVAVLSRPLLWLVRAKPTYTLVAMLMVTGEPIWVQVVPLADW